MKNCKKSLNFWMLRNPSFDILILVIWSKSNQTNNHNTTIKLNKNKTHLTKSSVQDPNGS